METSNPSKLRLLSIVAALTSTVVVLVAFGTLIWESAYSILGHRIAGYIEQISMGAGFWLSLPLGILDLILGILGFVKSMLGRVLTIVSLVAGLIGIFTFVYWWNFFSSMW